MVGPTAMGATVAAPMAAGPSMAPMMIPVAAPAARAQPIIINQTFQAAVMGAPHDVMRAVEDANRSIARLLPTVP
jgi:hypothetical protein